MLLPQEFDAVAGALIAARRDNVTLDAGPLAQVLTDAADAYAVQDRVAREFGWFETVPARHWKSGGPSRDAVLTHAPLPPNGVWTSPARSGAWPLRLRGIEAEIALRLVHDVDAALATTLDVGAARALVDAMAVAIEIVDSRWRQALDAPALCRLADLQSHSALVLGDWIAFDAARDWSTQVCRVRIGEAAPREWRGSHALADPCFVLPAWLRHATRGGALVRAGTVVTTGTWCGVLHARPGDTVQATFDGIGEARISFAH